jgi:hypothetical protein
LFSLLWDKFPENVCSAVENTGFLLRILGLIDKKKKKKKKKRFKRELRRILEDNLEFGGGGRKDRQARNFSCCLEERDG